tara:strand:+ start:91 stop:534 length:444 start_codon:yes stop_codon:yes gene_type:complete
MRIFIKIIIFFLFIACNSLALLQPSYAESLNKKRIHCEVKHNGELGSELFIEFKRFNKAKSISVSYGVGNPMYFDTIEDYELIEFEDDSLVKVGPYRISRTKLQLWQPDGDSYYGSCKLVKEDLTKEIEERAGIIDNKIKKKKELKF